jgi:hypothetical protein
VDTILRTRPYPEHGYRACLGLMHLGKRYEPERMLAACQRALQIGSTSYLSVNAILKNGLDKVPLPLEAESLAKIGAWLGSVPYAVVYAARRNESPPRR